MTIDLSLKDCAAIQIALDHFIAVSEQWETDNDEPCPYLAHLRGLHVRFYTLAENKAFYGEAATNSTPAGRVLPAVRL